MAAVARLRLPAGDGQAQWSSVRQVYRTSVTLSRILIIVRFGDFQAGSARVNFLRIQDQSRAGMTMSDTATLSAKFQISIPKAVRTAHRWKAGQEFAFIPKGTGVLLVPVPELAELSGLAKGAKAKNFRDRKDRF